MNKNSLVAILLICCVVMSMFLALHSATRGQPSIPVYVYVDPPTTSIAVCNDFVIHVKIMNVTYPNPALYAFQFFLVYDPAMITPIEAYDGEFLNEPKIFDWQVRHDDPLQGFDSVLCWGLSMPPAEPATGDGTLALILFHCIGAGDSILRLTDYVVLADENGIEYVPAAVDDGVVHQEGWPPAHTWIDPPELTVPVCMPFEVNVKVKDVPAEAPLHFFSLVVTCNTDVVDCIDIVDGGFLLPPTQVNHKLIDDDTGRIEFDLVSLASGGASGNGSLAKISFHCTEPGVCVLNLTSVSLISSNICPIPTTTEGGKIFQVTYWEPTKLIDIVEWPQACTRGYTLADIPFPYTFPYTDTPQGYFEILSLLADKGYTFESSHATAQKATIWKEDYIPTHGNVTSWWSSNTAEDGTRACMMSMEWEDPTMKNMTMGFITNLLPPEQILEVDPYIIVNAMPYMYVRFYWWAWPTDIAPGHVVSWSYWWYDSHSHPNWFWGLYWWWRTYTKAYYYPYTDVPYWQHSWGWWWHWVYWKHWYWWSTAFPYDP